MQKFETLGFNKLMQLAQKEAQKKENFGSEFNVSPAGDFYKLIAPFVYLCSYLEDKAISIARGLNLYTAQGTELDNLLYFFPRRQGSKAVISCTVKALEFIDVTAKDILIQDANGILFENIEAFEMTKNTVKTILFRSVIEGDSTNIKVNTIEKVVKAPRGIIDIQNITAGEGGLDAESDYEYLQRYLAINNKGEWALQPVINAVRRLSGVKSANGIRNNTMQIDQYGLQPKSIWIVVEGGIKEEIAKTIYSHIHTPDTKGSIEIEVDTSVPGYKEVIRFDRPQEVEVEYKATINSPEVLKIKKLIEEYINTTGIGALLSPGAFISGWLCATGYRYTDFELKFRKKGSTDWGTSLQMQFNEKAVSGGEQQ